jgi:hypothetical protein
MINPHPLKTLNSVWGFGEIVTTPVWKANFCEERPSVAPLISESYSNLESGPII